MSLLQRVTSLEALSPNRGRSPDGSRSPRDRKLSFSPLPGAWQPPHAHDEEPEVVEAIGAYDVPKGKRISQSCLIFVSCWQIRPVGLVFI